MSEPPDAGRRFGLLIAIAAAAALAVAVLLGARAGCLGRAPVPGEEGPERQYSVEEAPASRLKPSSVSAGLGGPGTRDEDLLDVGFVTSWSSDSELLAVVGGRAGDAHPALWVARGLDARPERLANRVSDAAFSPIGRSIVFTRVEGDGSQSVAVVSADGGAAALVSEQAAGPVWAPDGGRVVYLAGRADGTLDLAISDRPAADDAEPPKQRVLSRDVAAVRPAVAADGSDVFFIGANGELRIIGSDGRAAARPVEGVPAGRAVDEISVSSDGGRLLYLEVSRPSTVSPVGLSEPARGMARLLELDTGRTISPFGEREVTHPRLTSDGRRLWAGSDGGLYVGDTGTGSFGFVPIGRRRAYLPSPSPDGRSVIAISPSSDVAAALVVIRLGVFASDRTFLVLTDRLPANADPEQALERLGAFESASADETGPPAPPPGYPVAFPSDVFPELSAGKLVVAAGRFDLEADAGALAGRLRGAGVTTTVVPVR